MERISAIIEERADVDWISNQFTGDFSAEVPRSAETAPSWVFNVAERIGRTIERLSVLL